MIDIISTFALGLAVIIHPCTAAPNIATMTYIYSKSEKRSIVLWLYVLGHTALYLSLGLVISFLLRRGIIALGDQTPMEWMQPVLVSVFVISGILLIYSSLRSHHHHHTASSSRLFTSVPGSFIGGVLLAVAFCPEAAVAFFGVMIPLSVTSSAAYFIPVAYAAATAIPLALAAVVLHKGINLKLNYLQTGSKWFNLVMGVLFIITALIIQFL